MKKYWIAAISLFLIDLLLVGIPAIGLLLIWIVYAKPRWFAEWVQGLYRNE